MGCLILEPPKLYLDTCHLVNIANLRKGKFLGTEERRSAYAQIDTYIQDRHFGIVFNAAAPFEWVDGDATLETAMEIANVVESAKLQYEIDADHFVYLHEILRELRRLDGSLNLPVFEVFHVRDLNGTAKRALGVLAREVPDYFEGYDLPDLSLLAENLDVPFGEVREHVERAWKRKQERPDILQERVEGHKAAVAQDLDLYHSRKQKSFTQQDAIEWMKRFLRVGHVLNALNTEVGVDELLREVEIDNCPAVALYFAAHEKRIKAGQPAKDNDVDDWLYVPVFAYADLIMTERNLRAFVAQADAQTAQKATHDPALGVEILREWM